MIDKYIYIMNNNLCKKKIKYTIPKTSITPNEVHITVDNKVLKVIPLYTNKEYDIINVIYPKLKKTNINVLFTNIIKVQECGDKNYYLMDKYDGDINKSFLSKLNHNIQKNLLQQILFSILYMNNELKLFHNDLYVGIFLRNIMYKKIDKDIKLNYKNINIVCKNYLSKIIDFGWSENKPFFRTLQYHNKYFKKNKIISEVVIYSYFYLITIKGIKFSPKIIDILQKISDIVEKLLAEKNMLTQLNFDLEFYKFLFLYYDKIIK